MRKLCTKMYKDWLTSIMLAFALFGNINVWADSTSWSLLSNQTSSVSGQVTSGDMGIASVLQGTAYNSAFQTSTSWMRVGTTTGSQLPSAYSVTSYVEFTIAPATNYNLTVTSVTANLAGGGSGNNKIAAYYSLSNFSSTPGIALGNATYNSTSYAATTVNPISLLNTSSLTSSNEGLASFSPSINVSSGQTLKIRFYAWNAGSTTKYLAIKNIVISGSTTSLGSTPPTLTTESSPTVDGTFDVTFTDDATWRAAITGVKIGGTTLTSGYTISSGKITFTPSSSSPASLLQSSGSKAIAISATGYTDATVTQSLGFGAATKLGLQTQPAGPATNGAALATQPILNVQDQYSNIVTSNSSAVVTATVGDGNWSISGAGLVKTASSGIVTFYSIAASSYAAASNATITFTSPGLTSVTSNTFSLPVPVPPTITAATSPTVDAPIVVTFTDNPTWRGAITGITIGGTSLPSAAYDITTAGQITFTPSQSTLLQSAGSKTIVISSTGYANNTFTQLITAGAATKLGISSQPIAPASNGAVLATQPVLTILDQYNNITISTADVTASVGSGAWTLGGTTTKTASSGSATFTDLTATSAASVLSATISFASTGLTGISSGVFTIPAPAGTTPPTLTAASGPTVDSAFDITFTDDNTWQGTITGITVGGVELDPSAYNKTNANKITFTPSVSTLLQSSGSKTIVISATGYNDASISQIIGAGVATQLIIETQPAAPATNGTLLETQPEVSVKDQYGNLTDGTVIASVTGSQAWNLSGTSSKASLSGIVTFTDLTAGTTGKVALSNATLTFTCGSITTNSNTFDIIAYQSSVNDYFETIQTGDWGSISTWLSSPDNGSTWYAATIVPGTSATLTTIKSSHTAFVTANTAIGTTTIESGATLKTTGTSVVTVGTSKTLTINGTFENNGTVSDLVFTGATAVNFNSGSTYLLSGANLFIPGGTSIINWNSNSTVNVTGGIAGAWATTAGTVYGNITFNTSTITGSAVIFNAGNPMQRIAGNFTVSNLGTNGVIQLISSSNTNIVAIDGDYLQSSGTVLMNPSSYSSTTFRPLVVRGNFTMDGGNFIIANSTNAAGPSNSYLIIEGNMSLNGTSVLQNTATNGTGTGTAYIHLAGANTTFVRSATSSITATTGNMINFVVNPGCIVDMGNNVIDGGSNVNFTLNGSYTAPAIVGSTTSTTSGQANHLLTITNSASLSGIQPGMAISGGSIPANTYVTAVYSSTQLQISKGTTATATGVAFTVTPASSNAGTVKTSHVNGINGNIQVGGTKTLSSSGNYEFYGISNGQVTGSFMPASINNLTINNTNGVALSQATTVNGTLTLTSGVLSPATNLTLGSSANIVKTGGSLDAAPTFASSLTGITYSGSSSVTVGNEFPASAAITSLTINNTGGVTLANSLTSATNLTIGSGASLSVPAGKQLTISGTLSNSGTINLSSDANGTATILTPSGSAGTASVQQYLPQGRNWYISSPVASADATSISGANLGGSVVFYDEANSNWAPVTSTLTPGIGYISVASAGTATSNAIFNGILNNGDIPVTLSRKGATKAGFNLIANPYPSYLDGMAAVSSNANLEQTIWYRTKISGVYYFETVNTTSGVGSSPVEGSSVSRLIPPMQAFWIRTLTDNNTLTFTNAMRYHANPTISGSTITTTTMKAPKVLNNTMIRLKVSNGINSDETVIYSNENASNGYDIYDSQKMMNNSTTIPDLYSIIDNNSLVINGMNSLSTDTEIPLGFSPGSAGVFSIKASELSNLNADLDVYLKDSHDNSYNKLVQGDSYSFSSDNTATTSRFSIVLKSKSTTTDISNKQANDNVKIYANTNSQLVINCPEAMVGKAQLSIINAIGQIVIQQTITKSNMQINLPAGIYTINTGTMTSKVIIK